MQNVSLLFRSSVFAADYLHQELLEHRNANDAKKQTHFEMLTETLFWLVYVKQCPNGVNSNDPLRLSILLKLHHVNPS